MRELTKLAYMSDYYGSDPTLVLAGGGNTSYKTADVLYVKASGFPLSGIRENGFAALDRHGLQDLLLRGYPEDVENIDTQFIEDVMATRLPGEEKRPSVEALLHHGFDFPYVLHLHPTDINSLTSAVNGKEEAERLFGTDCVWVKLVHPGYGLARYCWDLQQEHKAKYGKYPRFLLLQNHGIFIPGNSPEEIGATLDEVIAKIRACYKAKWDSTLAPIDTDAIGAVREKLEAYYSDVLYCGEKSMVTMCQSREAADGVLRPYNPDQITYCRSWPLFVESVDAIDAGMKEYDETIGGKPKVIIVRGIGLFTAGADHGEADRAMQLFLDAGKISFYAENFGGYHQLDDDFIDFIDNWEVENYRRGIANKNL